MSRTTTKLAGVVDAKVLTAALKDVSAAIEARNTIPILSHVLLTVTPGQLVLLGSDLDIWVERTAPVDADSSFSVALEAATLGRLAGKLPPEARATIALDGSKVIVTAGRSRFTLPTLPVDDFPKLPREEWDAEFEVDAILLGRALARVSVAISTEETRYYLNGVYMHVAEVERTLRFASTDGHRLARVSTDLPDGAAQAPAVIIPRKTVRLLVGLLDRHEGKVSVAISGRKLRIEVGETTIMSKAVDGTFPDYTRVIPTANDRMLQIGRAALVDAVGRVTTVSSDKTRAVKIDLARDVATLSVTSPEHGQSVEEVPCSYASAPLTIGFNSRFLLDALGQLAADTIEVALGDAASPTLFRDGENAPAVFVVMPMRV